MSDPEACYAVYQDVHDRLVNDFTYHPPLNENQSARYDAIRSNVGAVARWLVRMCPRSRELSLALTKLDEVVFWANASIGRNEKEESDGDA